jgi:hypothetical protein
MEEDKRKSMTLTDLVHARNWKPTAKRLNHIAAYVRMYYLMWRPCATLGSAEPPLIEYEPSGFPFINAMLDQYATWYGYDGSQPSKKQAKVEGKGGKKKGNKQEASREEEQDDAQW